MDLIKLTSFCTTKVTKNKKTTYGIGGNVCKDATDRAEFLIYINISIDQYIKKKKPSPKVGAT